MERTGDSSVRHGQGGRESAPRARPSGRRLRLAGAVLVAVGFAAIAGNRFTAFGRAPDLAVFSGPLPACAVDDLSAPHAAYADWDRTLLDTALALDRTYEPDDLTSVAEAAMTGVGTVRALVILDLEALGRAARKAGVEIAVDSAYRTFDAQARTFDSLARANGRDYALRSAARPGHSEHQLGTTIDFAGGEAWLAEHAWRFGFVMSYPPDRSPAFTCYKAEPWHYRYFGRARATAIQAAGISPREWLWQHADDRG
jgi:D-alanyl-D-alanine carboxypeptidase